ncbi:MAG: DUF4292 domain-containing protein [Syntrophales bacterium]|jgi:hypothetical protein|nr:DUF4292 domain-containing protein [Syntrophales bacterium]
MTGLRCSLPKAGANNLSVGFCLPDVASLFLLFIFLISLLGGCAHDPLHPATGAEYRLSPEEVLGTIDLRDSRKTFMKAVAQVVVNTEEGRYPLKLAILAVKPASLRLEAIPIIGLPNFFLSIHNGTMKVYLPQNGEYYVGPATINNLKSFFPIQLAVPDLVALLMGCRPTMSSENTILKGSSEGKSYRVDILSRENQALQSLWIDPENFYLTRLDRFGKSGEKLLTANFDEYFQDNDVSMPSRVRFQMPGKDERDITLRYDDATFAPLTNETERIFDLPVPEGVKTIILK